MGIEVIDNSKTCQNLVHLKGSLLWTMHDYLGYGDVISDTEAVQLHGLDMLALQPASLDVVLRRWHRGCDL